MKSINRVLKTLPPCQSARYVSEAKRIYKHLLLGFNYRELGGRKLNIDPRLIRFKLGSYRLIFVFSDGVFQPKVLLARKDFESYLKRR
ncbi:hypothetical protein [Pseudoalteromonas sp. 10-33]|uniref:hypothetical protein n=1 Tax=Pseudoalteromonas sp. 10-33 TaxID=1761890 RepID=UPI00073203E1|nr:hypothetical protein [Pseudoalteromonas sp. 10-33]KTF08635.1 hypothetical protein ATS76_13505 [Pseudoalteromonas sp. 10-33]